jgi:hypothetical protein
MSAFYNSKLIPIENFHFQIMNEMDKPHSYSDWQFHYFRDVALRHYLRCHWVFLQWLMYVASAIVMCNRAEPLLFWPREEQAMMQGKRSELRRLYLRTEKPTSWVNNIRKVLRIGLRPRISPADEGSLTSHVTNGISETTETATRMFAEELRVRKYFISNWKLHSSK